MRHTGPLRATPGVARRLRESPVPCGLIAAPPSVTGPRPGDRSDADLVAAARGGHRAATEALLRRHHERVAALCRRMMGADGAPDATQEALARLPDAFRAPVVLGDLCQLDDAEIAGVLGLAPGTLRSWIARGRAALAADLDPAGNPAGVAERRSDEP